jgi:hypothetical protein
MERSLAGMLFVVAGVSLALASGGWWMQRIVFTPNANRETAAAILSEPEIRQEINGIVATATSPVIGRPLPELSPWLETEILSTSAGAAMMAPLTREIHDRVIGNRDQFQIQITGDQMVNIVRDHKAAEVSPVILPVPVIGTLKTTRIVIGWMIPITAVIGLIALLLGIFTRPERRDTLRGLGEFCFAMAVSMLVFGYLIPVQLLPAIDNGTWAQAIPQLAMRTIGVVLGAAVIFGLAGGALMLSSTSSGKRRQWSTPLSVARYRGGDNPGWG